MKLSKEYIDKLNAELPRGSKQVIADETGIKISTVRQMFCGYRSMSDNVFEAALNLAQSNRNAVQSKIERLNMLVA